MSENEELIKVIQNGSKAVVAVAEGYTASVELVGKIIGSLAKYIDKPMAEIIGICVDDLKIFRQEHRLKRLVRAFDRINLFLNERGLVEINPLPLKFAIPMFEQTSLEEEDYLQDIWCKLITNTLDPCFDVEIRYAYIDMIRSLTSLDAKILKYIYETTVKASTEKQLEEIEEYPVSFDDIMKNITASSREIEISLNNLKRVQCIWDNDVAMAVRGIANSIVRDKSKVTPLEKAYEITALGFYFVKACII